MNVSKPRSELRYINEKEGKIGRFKNIKQILFIEEVKNTSGFL